MRAHVRNSAVGFLVTLVVATIVAAGAGIAPGRSATTATGTLELRAALRLVSRADGGCPPGVMASGCAARTGEGLVSGLGSVTEAYTFQVDVSGSPPCGAGFGRALGYPVSFIVAGKGQIHFTLADGEHCVDEEAVRVQAQAFTVTGGTGNYVGASGSGTVERVLGSQGPAGRVGRETWTGTLVVPGLEFDTTPPSISGAVAKTVRAPRGARRARVVYTVTARDDIDGAVPVPCVPRSGSRFAIGRTVVTCSAADTSANVRTARFTVTVRQRR